MNNDVLAWYQYPEPDGKSYDESDLANPEVLEEIFDYCQILLGVINAKGWQYLLTSYSFDQLAKIDEKSGWFYPCTMEEFQESIKYEALISGYNSATREFGSYDEETGIFVPSKS